MSHGGDTERLQGAKIALTGRFAAITQQEAAELSVRFGGEYVVGLPTRHTDYLVVGSAAPPLAGDGHPTASLQRARHLQSCGYSIEIITEEAFLSKLGLVEHDAAVHQRYTVAQLSRIVGVSRDRIRSWVRLGLIEPVQTVHRLDFFDYQQVTTAKLLCELVAGGLPLSRIREGLQRMHGWLSGMDRPLCQLSVLEQNGRLLVRLNDGRLAETSGQLQLEFPDPDADCALAMQAASKTADDWFQEALEYENEGDFSAAAAAYQEAILLEPNDPILHFNLGNTLYATDRRQDAVDHFRQAVELDVEYVEAWNNLGTVLAELDEYDDSIVAFHRALAVFPLYADAHFNLGDVFAAIGQEEDACRHWRQYLQLDPKSPWADDVRQRLARLEMAHADH